MKLSYRPILFDPDRTGNKYVERHGPGIWMSNGLRVSTLGCISYETAYLELVRDRQVPDTNPEPESQEPEPQEPPRCLAMFTMQSRCIDDCYGLIGELHQQVKDLKARLDNWEAGMDARFKLQAKRINKWEDRVCDIEAIISTHNVRLRAHEARMGD